MCSMISFTCILINGLFSQERGSSLRCKQQTQPVSVAEPVAHPTGNQKVAWVGGGAGVWGGGGGG